MAARQEGESEPLACEELWQLNGCLGANLPLNDRGLAYGDGLFETCLVKTQGKKAVIPCWPYHKARLLRGCKRLALPLQAEALEADLAGFLTHLPAGVDGIVKLIVTRGQGGRGYVPPVSQSLNILWQLLPAPIAGDQPQGVSLALSDVRLARQPLLAGIKHLNRLEYVLAAQRCKESIPLLLDEQGCVIETLSHNIFCVIDGAIKTPRLNDCGVAGVLRAVMFDRLAAQLPCSVTECELTLPDLAAASEVFIGNSVRGIWPVTRLNALDSRPSWPVGPKALQLQQAWRGYLFS